MDRARTLNPRNWLSIARVFAAEWLLPPRVKDSVAMLFGPSADINLDIPAKPAAINAMRWRIDGGVNVVALEKIRYHTGQAFTLEQHHFVRFLGGGEESLRRFYDIHQPKSILETYFLRDANESLQTGIIPRIREPWFLPYEKQSTRGEGGLPISDGVQSWGPVSARKCAYEVKRLTRVLESIVTSGFVWNFRGDPMRAYLLIDDKHGMDYRAVVCGGNHRIAALSHIGIEMIPLTFQPNYPREIRLSEVLQWPMVQSGRISAHDATRVFRSFFREPTEVLLPNW